jgi:thymidine kinase
MTEEASLIIKPREPFSDALLPQSTDELAKFMDQPLTAIAETITGALAAGPKDWMLRTGHIVQAILQGKLYQQVSREIKELRDKGKIPDDFADEKKYKYGFRSWVDLLKTIDEKPPDADLLEALMAMFYGVNRVNTTDEQRMLSYRLFQTAKRLNSSELVLLQTLYDAFKKQNYQHGQMGLMAWADKIAKLQGHNLTALVLKDEQVLMAEQLIVGYMDATVTATRQAVVENNARLSDMGLAFCQNIETYRRDTAPEPQ